MVKLKYIGWRPNHIDGYARLLWPETGHVNDVPDIHAANMLARHKDVYELVEQLAADEAVDKTEEVEIEEAHALRQYVTTMDKTQLNEFAEAKFGQKLDGRLGLEGARAKVLNMIDLYGVP